MSSHKSNVQRSKPMQSWVINGILNSQIFSELAFFGISGCRHELRVL